METVLAILTAIPKLKELFDEFVKFYVERQIAQMKKDHRDGIKKAIEMQDQRDLEKAIGSPLAGEPSGIAGTETRDTLPGVKP